MQARNRSAEDGGVAGGVSKQFPGVGRLDGSVSTDPKPVQAVRQTEEVLDKVLAVFAGTLSSLHLMLAAAMLDVAGPDEIHVAQNDGQDSVYVVRVAFFAARLALRLHESLQGTGDPGEGV